MRDYTSHIYINVVFFPHCLSRRILTSTHIFTSTSSCSSRICRFLNLYLSSAARLCSSSFSFSWCAGPIARWCTAQLTTKFCLIIYTATFQILFTCQMKPAQYLYHKHVRFAYRYCLN